MAHESQKDKWITEWQIKLYRYQDELKKYENDFSIISDCSDETIKILAVAKNTLDLSDSLDNSINLYTEHIEYLKGIPQITEYIRLDNITEPTEFKYAIQEFIEMTEHNCRYFDYLKEQLATEIERVNNHIIECENTIDYYRNTYREDFILH